MIHCWIETMCRCAYPKQHKADLSVRQDVSVWPQILNYLSNNYTSLADSDVASAQGEQAEAKRSTSRCAVHLPQVVLDKLAWALTDGAIGSKINGSFLTNSQLIKSRHSTPLYFQVLQIAIIDFETCSNSRGSTIETRFTFQLYKSDYLFRLQFVVRSPRVFLVHALVEVG